MRASGAENTDGATLVEHQSGDGQAGLSVEIFGLMTQLFPDHPDGYRSLAEACTQARQPDAVREAHQCAVDIDPAIVPIAAR